MTVSSQASAAVAVHHKVTLHHKDHTVSKVHHKVIPVIPETHSEPAAKKKEKVLIM
jgi:hypothetical protein